MSALHPLPPQEQLLGLPGTEVGPEKGGRLGSLECCPLPSPSFLSKAFSDTNLQTGAQTRNADGHTTGSRVLPGVRPRHGGRATIPEPHPQAQACSSPELGVRGAAGGHLVAQPPRHSVPEGINQPGRTQFHTDFICGHSLS